MTLRTVGSAALLAVALATSACREEPAALSPKSSPAAVSTTHQALGAGNKVLILGSTVNGGLDSREARAVSTYAPTAQIDVVTPEKWASMTAQEFMAYRALIIGDAACESGTAAFQAAIDSRRNWGAIVDGDVAILATDPSSNGTDQLVENAIHYVLNSVQYRTGMYISLGCAYQSAPADTEVTLLEPFGTFKIQGVPGCADSGHIFEMYNDFMSRDVWDGMLSGAGGCTARSVFTSYPDRSFSYAGLAMQSSGTLPGQHYYTDFTIDPGAETPYVGTPYILVRGAMTMGAGCGIPEAPSGEECDLGDGLNGMPALSNQQPWETCSWSCHNNWCGDGVVDTEFGEECDLGEANGRTTDSLSDSLGTCTAFCKVPNPMAPVSQPPVALCQDVTAVAEYTCGATAGIDSGSYDPDNDLVGCTQSPAGPYNVGSTLVTLTCTDQAGHSASCTGTVTVVDSTPPTIALNGEPNQALECTAGATYNDPGASATDQCGGVLPPSSITRTGSVNMGAPSTYSLSYVAADAAGNTSDTVFRTVTVADTLAPVITRLGTDTTHECGWPYTDPGVTAADQCEGNLTSRVIKTGSLNTGAVGDYILRYNVKDTGNRAAAEVTRTIFVRDRQKPTVTLNAPTSQTVECGSTYADPGATASDVCVGTLTATVASSNLNMRVPGNYSLTYRAVDPSGNLSLSASRSVTVADTRAPTLTLNGQAAMTLECATPFIDPGASASDQCQGDLSSQIIKTGSVNPGALGFYTLAYNVRDASNNAAPAVSRTVRVQDTGVPSVTITGALNVAVECGTSYADPGATATDACAGTLEAVRLGVVDTQTPGTYGIGYKAVDPSGNSGFSTSVRTVVVSDTLAPTLTLNGPATLALECGSPFSDPGASATDLCAGNVPVSAYGAVNSQIPASYALTYVATDGRNHFTTANRTVAVSDTLPPTLTLNGPAALALECGSPFNDPGASANDQCAGSLPVTVAGSVNSSAPNSYALTYSATDGQGHSASASRTVAVSDTLAPVIAVNGPLDVTYECGSSYVDPGATATDACAGDLTAQIQPIQTGDPSQPSTFTITYSVTDPSGNTTVSPVQRTVHVNDNEPPTLALLGPATQALECGSPYTDPGAIANDVCFGDVTSRITRSGTVNTGAPGAYALVYDVTDPAGQTAPPLVRTVSVSDTLAPSITVLGELSQQVQCGSAYVDPGASASDVCAGDLSASVVRTGSVDTAAVGTYTLGYSVADPSGNAATAAATRSVSVIDTLAPTLSLLGPATQTLECGSHFRDPGAIASDACAGDLTPAIVQTGSVNAAAPGSYSLDYSVADASGNAASVSRAVTVVDTLAPQLYVLGGAATVQCNGAPYVDQGATATDACAGDLTSQISSSSNLDQTRAGQYAVTYSVTDAAGHTSTATRQVTVAGPCAVSCIDVHLNDYNLFLEGSYTGGHDVVGKVAAGGNITMQDFAVGSGLPASDIANTLVAGGNLTLDRGAVWGDAAYGGSFSTNPSVTFPRGTAAQGMPIDFATRFAELRGVSAQLAALPANGTTRRESWGGVMLRGTNPGVNVFDVQASAFTGAVLFYIEAPAGSFVVVNIRGASATFQGFGTSFGGGIDQHGILYNFVDTTSINASGYGFWGTVLAPYANVTFSNGSWDGGMYARSLTGNAEGHINTLNDRTICQ